ncbi:MAG: oxygen-dependent coproporphyrinogen oxidase [Pseudomonadales bacterium]|nr:oxygen-dependent coproporphyrinogen oxidase [Pseudomonadales bacterium]
MPDISLVNQYFLELQNKICTDLGSRENTAAFSAEDIATAQGGHSRPRVLENGQHVEKAAVLCSHSVGAALPQAATERNPQLAGKGFEASAISMIVHPRNPYIPTFHANLRFFLIDEDNWYFGGGFDLTPYYAFPEDVLHWHRTAEDACKPFGNNLYGMLKAQCDEYFFLPHRGEPRGVGGIFFDDWTEGGFERAFTFVQSVGDHIMPAYLPILDRRKDHPYSTKEEEFMMFRRGRYAEFNLAIDRGTLYGLQSGRRIESVLASMPPRAMWKYNWSPETGSAEADLYENYLRARDWLVELL